MHASAHPNIKKKEYKDTERHTHGHKRDDEKKKFKEEETEMLCVREGFVDDMMEHGGSKNQPQAELIGVGVTPQTNGSLLYTALEHAAHGEKMRMSRRVFFLVVHTVHVSVHAASFISVVRVLAWKGKSTA